MEYHMWRNLYPPGPHPWSNTLQSLGIGTRSLCELCRFIRDKRKDKRGQYYKSVCFNILNIQILILFAQHVNMLFDFFTQHERARQLSHRICAFCLFAVKNFTGPKIEDLKSRFTSGVLNNF